MPKKSIFNYLRAAWEDYDIEITLSPRSGYEVVFYELKDSERKEIKRRHCREGDVAIGVMTTWYHQIEEGRVRK